MNVAVIGSGLAGIAAADALTRAGEPVTVYEARPWWGGHTHTLVQNGFAFDEGPHVSFAKDEQVREIFLRGAGELNEFQGRISNWFHGSWVTHPAQCHLYGLDKDLVTRCVVDFVAAQAKERIVTTYADWLRATYGDTFAETFPFAYTRKYWTVEPEELTTEWIGPRMYPPSVEEVVRGAIAPGNAGDFHYLKTFRYPASGGYQSFMNALVQRQLIEVDHEVVRVNVESKELTFANGQRASYDRLISTMPLPDLVRAIGPGLPAQAVLDAADRLLCTSVVLVDVAVARSDLSDSHWFYVYDEDLAISRVHFPHMLARANAPEGRGSIQAEVYFSSRRPLAMPVEDVADRVIAELTRMGILRGPGDVLWTRTRTVPYANVVFDHHRSAALAVLLPWVREQGIVLAGRYGMWGYHWTDDATRSGWAASEEILAPVPGQA